MTSYEQEMPSMESEKRAKLEEQLRYLQKREAEQESVGELEGSGQVRSALDNLGLQVEKAHALVAQLEDRLDVVLLPEAPSASDLEGTAKLQRSASHLTGTIREHYSALRALLDRLSRLSNRVDL